VIRLKRAYEAPTGDDGRRVLVERLWPRGLTRQAARFDLWLKEAAPSAELRRWFRHDPAKWPEFQRRYREELRQRPEVVTRLVGLVEEGPITFVYGSRDERHNAAIVLKAFVEDKAAARRAASRPPGEGPP
jgi:uncharacterized protein YeaO (DUF488 family)